MKVDSRHRLSRSTARSEAGGDALDWRWVAAMTLNVAVTVTLEPGSQVGASKGAPASASLLEDVVLARLVASSPVTGFGSVES